MLSIPLFINFLPKVEFIACEPSLTPKLAKLSAILFTVCLRLFFFILFKAIADRLNLPYFLLDIFLSRFASLIEIIPLFLFLGPIVQTFLTLMLEGNRFLLILSYLDVKVVPFGNVRTFGIVLLLNTIFCLIIFIFFFYV